MAGVYCGSNQLNTQLVGNGGLKTIGSRNQCLRKGIGQGLHMPVDLSYNNPYQPIDPRRFYCGDNGILPAGYSANGTLHQCFNTGIGVGRHQLAQRAIGAPVPVPVPVVPIVPVPVPIVPIIPIPVPVVPVLITPIVLFILINAIFIITLLYTKPSFITKDVQGNREIDWSIFSPYIVIFSLVSGFILYRIYL